MDKQNMVYSYNGILFGKEKEWSTDTCYNLDESWKHYAKWKKPIQKHILYPQPFSILVSNNCHANVYKKNKFALYHCILVNK